MQPNAQAPLSMGVVLLDSKGLVSSGNAVARDVRAFSRRYLAPGLARGIWPTALLSFSAPIFWSTDCALKSVRRNEFDCNALGRAPCIAGARLQHDSLFGKLDGKHHMAWSAPTCCARPGFFPRRAPNSENLLASASGGSSRGISCLWMILGRRVLQRVCPAYLLPLVSCGSLSRISLSSPVVASPLSVLSLCVLRARCFHDAAFRVNDNGWRRENTELTLRVRGPTRRTRHNFSRH